MTDSMWVNTNRPLHDGGPWTMVAEVWVINHYGPDCSLKAYPGVTFKEWGPTTRQENGSLIRHEVTRGPTTQTRSDVLSEAWVDLPWTPSHLYDESRLGRFRIYTTRLDADGRSCPEERMLLGEVLNITIPGIDKTFQEHGMPTDEGPKITSCDGRIAVTPFAQLR
jgi:hypothetical protein